MVLSFDTDHMDNHMDIGYHTSHTMFKTPKGITKAMLIPSQPYIGHICSSQIIVSVGFAPLCLNCRKLSKITMFTLKCTIPCFNTDCTNTQKDLGLPVAGLTFYTFLTAHL